jgi:fucose 4-O-acetylase-like acetyltransferase
MQNNNLGDEIVARATRVDSLDLYKGLAILLVVAGHLIQRATPEFDKSLLFKGIYMFHMPLFFLICGMVYALKPSKLSFSGLGHAIAKRAMQLLLPFIAWYMVGYFIFYQHVAFSEHLLKLWESPDAGLWFLWVLFVFTCIADAGRFVAGATRLPLWLLLVVSWACLFHLRINHSALGIGLIAFQMPFFVAGIFHRDILRGASRWYVALLTTICSVAFPVLVHHWDRVNQPEIGLMLQQAYSLPMSTGLYTAYLALGYLYQAIFAVVGIVVFFVSAKAFAEAATMSHKATRCLCFVGRRSLEIYALHFYLIQYGYFNASPFMNGLVTMVMAPLLSIMIADYLLKPNKVAALLLFGKPPRRKPV